MGYNNSEILNRAFSRNMLRNFIIGNNDKVYHDIVRKYVVGNNIKTNGQFLTEIYDILKSGYRNEYYYKNTLFNKQLLGIHSLNTTSALTEVQVAKSKADFIVINGKAVVYEIKTELDNLHRLNNQINDYYKVFDHVAVLTCGKYLKNVEELLKLNGKPVGIYLLQNNEKIKTIKKPLQYSYELDKEIIFKFLRKPEYEIIINKFYGYLPNVSQFEYYRTCKNMFKNLCISELYPLFLSVVKNRPEIIKEVIFSAPYELKSLVYFMELDKDDYQKLEVFLNLEFGGY